MPDGRVLRYVYDGLGRLRGQFESDAAGVLQLTKAWTIETAAVPAFVTLSDRGAKASSRL